jgi:hypothetical protein
MFTDMGSGNNIHQIEVISEVQRVRLVLLQSSFSIGKRHTKRVL